MLDLNALRVEEIPAIVKAGRSGKTSEYLPIFQGMAKRAIEEKHDVTLPVSELDDGWVIKNGKRIGHKAYSAATVWGKANGISFSFRNMAGPGPGKLGVNADKSKKVQEAIAAAEKQTA